MVKDILIIGCGPTGLYAWKMAVDLGLTGTIIEAKSTYGGQVMSMYPEKYIYNFPAIPKIIGKDAMHSMFDAVNKDISKIDLLFNKSVKQIRAIQPLEEVQLYENWFEVEFDDKSKEVYKRILISDGIGTFKPIPLCEKEYENIFYNVNDLRLLKDKKIIVFGGGDSAVDWANELVEIASSITIIHRRDEFRAKPGNLEKAISSGVKILKSYEFVNITKEENNKALSIEVKRVDDQNSLHLDFDYIIVQFGQSIQKDIHKNLEIEINRVNKFLVNYNMETSVKGIYAAGDCCWYETKIRNLLSGFYEAMHSVFNIEKTVHQRKILNNGW